MPIKVAADPTAKSFLVGETVTFRLTIQSAAPQLVTVPDPLLNEMDPVYDVTGPDGVTSRVKLLSARASSPLVEPMAPPAEITVQLPAGGVWSEEMMLDPMLLLTVPGPYRLEATVSHDGQTAKSPSASFAMEATHVTAHAAAVAPPKTLDARLSTVWVHSGASGVQVVEAVRLGHAWGDDRRGKLYSNTIYRGTGGPVTEVAVSQSTILRGMDFHGWVAWVAPEGIWAVRSNAGKPEGGAEVVHRTSAEVSLVEPLAMEASYDMRLHAVERTAAGADLLRIDVSRRLPAVIDVASRTPLPVAPRAAIALHGDGVETVVVLGGPQGNAAVLAIVEDGARPRATVVGSLGAWIPGRPLAVRRTAEGRVVIGCLAANPDKPSEARLSSITLGGSPLQRLSESHSDIPDLDPAAVRWVSVVLGSDGGHVLWRDTKGELRYRSPSGTIRPLEESFADTPVPAMLAADGEAFVSGVRADGSFSVESLAPHGHHH